MVPYNNHLIEPHLIPVPAGSYVVGTSDEQIERLDQRSTTAWRWREKGCFRREQPQHTVRLAEFRIAKYPVTVAEFRLFLADGAYRQREHWDGAAWAWVERTGRTEPDYWHEPKWTADPRLPVVGVSWHEAVAYSHWLARKTAEAYRLPTEAEWEAVARGLAGQMYLWGEIFDANCCNSRDSGTEQTVVSDRFATTNTSPFGAVDMLGNASEWTMSLFWSYPIQNDDGRDDPEAGGERVIRGGSWSSPAIRARATARGMNDPEFSDNDLGFRLAAGR